MGYQSNVNLADEKKVDAIVGLLSVVHQHVSHWHAHAYSATTWSIGIILGIGYYWLTTGGDLVQRCFLVGGTLVFTVLAQIYLHAAYVALTGNGRVIVKCEASLRLTLTEEAAYLKNRSFFPVPPSEEWVRPWDIIALRFYHAAVGILAAAAIWFFR